MHQDDPAAGWGWVVLPYALARKCSNAERQWAWQWLFPQRHRWRDPATGQQGRHQLDPSLVQNAVRNMVMAAGIHKPDTPSPFAIPSGSPTLAFGQVMPPNCWNGARTFGPSRS